MIIPVNDIASAAPKSELRQAAEGFEAIMLRQMLAAARTSDMGDDLFGGAGQDTFAEMRDAHFADVAAGSGMLGLADMLEAQLARSGAAQEL